MMPVMYSGRSGGSSPFMMPVFCVQMGGCRREVRDGGAVERFRSCGRQRGLACGRRMQFSGQVPEQMNEC